MMNVAAISIGRKIVDEADFWLSPAADILSLYDLRIYASLD